MNQVIKDAAKTHWVYKTPPSIRPYLQLSRLDRPVGYWLLALPGWIGLAFASLSHGLAISDLKWAALILIGAIAMRGAGCTYNDIVDQDLDAQVERTALRPLPAGTVSTKQAWLWLFAQCFVGLLVLLCLPRLAQIIALCSIPLVAAYPFMKRITWWPQLWLGMTFNWAVLVAYAAKTGTVSGPLFILYLGLIFWTVGYDTIYACQDIEDDAMIGVKSTARRFGTRIKKALHLCYLLTYSSIIFASYLEMMASYVTYKPLSQQKLSLEILLIAIPFSVGLVWLNRKIDLTSNYETLSRFKQNVWIMVVLIFCMIMTSYLVHSYSFTKNFFTPS